MMNEKITITKLKQMKERGEKITMLTAYDYITAKIIDEAGVDIILIGDSLGNVVLGYETTLPVTMEDMLHHTRPVALAAKRSLVVGDMPFMSYQVSTKESVRNAGRFLKEGGAQAVKVEGGREVAKTVRRIVGSGIPVMGHLGLTPQSVHQLGGLRVQARDKEQAQKLIEDAQILEEAGAFSIVLECVPAELARVVTSSISIPTIGIGAGADCDGQVLVTQDLLGLYDKSLPKFVKKYANLIDPIKEALNQYMEEVRSGKFPDEEHSYHIDEKVLEDLEVKIQDARYRMQDD